MDIRRRNCVEAFEKLGMVDADSLLGEYSQAGVFAGIENGSLTPDEFHRQIREIIGRGVTDRQIDEAFQEFLLGIPEHRLYELEELHKKYKIYMLSNTNPIMWAGEISRNFRKHGHDVDYYFDGIVRSYEAKAMKPDPAIFQFVIDRLGIDPTETLFFDDSQSNLDAAAEFGFKTALVKPGEEFAELMNALEK